MPELPEVETTRRGIEPHLCGQRVTAVVIRQPRLRWPIPPEVAARLTDRTVTAVRRRAKYLLLDVEGGSALLHLGMSGSLRVIAAETPPGKHDHVDIRLESGQSLRLTDPRRFGALLWSEAGATHPLLASLGPEPLSGEFNGTHLYRASRGRRGAVKPFIMDSQVVVGVGNIYANEALYLAGIHPARAAGRISAARYDRLARAITAVLHKAIAEGGTTLRDFVGGDGRPGYFAQHLHVYGREGEPCPGCGAPIRQQRLGQRSSYYCSRCQR